MEVTITWRIIQWFWPLKPWGSEAAVETPRSVNWPSFFEPRVLACGAHGLVGASGLTRIWRDWLSIRYVIWVCFKVAEKTIDSCYCSTIFCWDLLGSQFGSTPPFSCKYFWSPTILGVLLLSPKAALTPRGVGALIHGNAAHRFHLAGYRCPSGWQGEFLESGSDLVIDISSKRNVEGQFPGLWAQVLRGCAPLRFLLRVYI